MLRTRIDRLISNEKSKLNSNVGPSNFKSRSLRFHSNAVSPVWIGRVVNALELVLNVEPVFVLGFGFEIEIVDVASDDKLAVIFNFDDIVDVIV